MGVYDRQIATAKRLIKAKGQLVTWVPQSVATPDGTKPWKTIPNGTPPAPVPVSIVFTDISKRPIYALFKLMQGTAVIDGEIEGLMAQVTFVPSINDTVQRGTVNLVVK